MARPSLQNNVKFKALVRRLNLPRPYVRGLLDTMWDVANESGNPVLGNPDDVESAAEWPADPGQLFTALRDLNLVDELEDGRWVIHDYWDHAPHYVKNRKAMELRRKRLGARQNGGKSDNRENSDLRSESVTQCKTVAQMCTTPAPAPIKTPKGVLSPAGDTADKSVEPAAPKAKAKPRASNAGKVRDAKAQDGKPEHAELRSYFREQWKARNGADYAWKHPRDDAHAKWILDACGRDFAQAKAAVDHFFADEDRWIAERGHEVGILVSCFNRYRAKAPAEPDGNGFVRAERTDAEWDSLLMEGGT